MTQLPQYLDLSQKDTDRSLTAIKNYVEQISTIINGGISLGDGTKADNVNLIWFSTTTPGADVEFVISHKLGRVPVGWLILKQDKAGSVYASATPWTTTNIYLKCSVAAVTLTGVVL